MEYTSIYKKVNNPLDDNSVIKSLILAYSTGRDFYDELTKVGAGHKEMRYNIADSDDLHASIFNAWRKQMLSISRENYEDAIKRGLYDKDIYKLLAYLKNVPIVHTKKEANKYLNLVCEDKELERAMEKYRWDSIGEFSGWTHIHARYITGKKVVIPDVEHRLYINTQSTDLHKMAKLLLTKCAKYNMPFYFKISEYECRDDNIVIYSDTKHLPQYIRILEEIEKEHPDLVERCGKPPVLCGTIGKWIGYGSEPLDKETKESFNSKRAASIEAAINEELKEWFKTNIKSRVRDGSTEISLYEYLCKQIAKTKIDKMIEMKQKYPNSMAYKYSLEEVSSPVFKARLEKAVAEKAHILMKNFILGKKNETVIEAELNSDYIVKLYGSDVVKEMKMFLPAIVKSDSSIVDKIKARIVEDAKRIGVDPKKYCFDTRNVQLLASEEVEQASTSETKTESTPYTYKPMTDAEILASQKKLAFIPNAKPKK